jgi:hypothetical protein
VGWDNYRWGPKVGTDGGIPTLPGSGGSLWDWSAMSGPQPLPVAFGGGGSGGWAGLGTAVPSAILKGGGSGGGSGLGGYASLGTRLLQGGKNFLGMGENQMVKLSGGRGASGGAIWANDTGDFSFGDKMTALGKSPAAAMGGSMLLMNGLSRGGKLGLAEDTGGGALLGFQIGGPVGALVGAIAGAAAGGIRMLIETKEEQAKRLAKQLYGVNIDTALANQIVGVAKSKYSGEVQVAIRDPEVRKTIELYAAATGQKMPLSATTPHGASLVEQGGTLYQAPTYQYGNPYTYQSSLPTAGGFSTGQWPSTGPMMLQVNVGGEGAGAFVAGKVVTPEFVQSQWSQAGASSDGRTSNSAMLQQPNLIVS